MLPVLGWDPLVTQTGDLVPNLTMRYGYDDWTVADGNWSSASVWNSGTVPTSSKNVVIQNSVTIDSTSGSPAAKGIAIVDGGTLKTGTTGTMSLSCLWLQVLPKFNADGSAAITGGGLLQIGTPAAPVTGTFTLSFQDSPFATSGTAGDGTHGEANDPEQYGHGLLVCGQIVVCGTAKTPFSRCSTEPAAGGTSIGVQSGVTGWASGDKVYFPDSTAYPFANAPPDLTPPGTLAEDTLTLSAAVPTGGTSLSFTSGFVNAHPGGYDYLNNLDTSCLPHAVNVTRNVVFKAASYPATTPPHVMFTDTAYVDIQNAQFDGFGRTTCLATDSTTFSTAPVAGTTYPSTAAQKGSVTGTGGRFGPNQKGRYAVHVHHLIGRSGSLITEGSSSYIARFKGNYISRSAVSTTDLTKPGKGALIIHETGFGYYGGNVVWQANGSGVVSEGEGEYKNVIENNFVASIRGSGNRNDDPTYGPWSDGSCFNLASPWNYVRGNVANAPYSAGYAKGFQIWLNPFTSEWVIGSSVCPSSAGQAYSSWTSQDPSNSVIQQFDSNETYGAYNHLGIWEVGCYGTASDGGPQYHTSLGQSAFTNMKAWSCSNILIFPYVCWNCKYQLKYRGNPSWSVVCTYGFFPSDYPNTLTVLDSCDIQGVVDGAYVPSVTSDNKTTGSNPDFTISNSTFSCTEALLFAQVPWSVDAGGPYTSPIKVTLSSNTLYLAQGASGTPTYVYWQWPENMGSDILKKYQIFVTGYGGHNYTVYHQEQAGSVVVPETGSDSGLIVRGAPHHSPAYTNTTLWAALSEAFYGGVMPTGTATVDWVYQGSVVQTS